MADSALIEKAKKIFENFLLRQGSRKTPERYSVLDELYLLPEDEHIDVEGLFLKMRNKGYTISRATIYNTLFRSSPDRYQGGNEQGIWVHHYQPLPSAVWGLPHQEL